MTPTSDASESFLGAFLAEVSSDLLNDHDDNYDYYRFGVHPRSRSNAWSLLRNMVKKQLRKRGYIRIKETVTAIRSIEPHLVHFQVLYDQFDDNLSRDLVVKLLAFRCLGQRRVKLPLNTPSYWEGLRTIEKLADRSDFIRPYFEDWRLFRMDLNHIGQPVVLYQGVQAAYQLFVLKQYGGVSERGVVQVEPTDYVIDAGACWGDTALHFAHLAGPMGRVYGFEFVPRNLEILKRNLALNPDLSERVKIVERAVWSESDLTASIKEDGTGSAVSIEEAARVDGTVPTLAIDDFVARERLPRVDFIKMDIEGAELPALKGAVQTLRRFKPKLAISVYHRPADFFEIPEFICSLDLGYRPFLRHFTIHSEETILFAKAGTA